MSHTPAQWNNRYPDFDQLRTETCCLAACVRDVLLAQLPADEIRDIYLTGSTVKPWDSPLDYVPEVSDVDIHVSFRNDSAWREHLDTVSQALAIHAGIEACFEKRVARPQPPRPLLPDQPTRQRRRRSTNQRTTTVSPARTPRSSASRALTGPSRTCRNADAA